MIYNFGIEQKLIWVLNLGENKDQISAKVEMKLSMWLMLMTKLMTMINN